MASSATTTATTTAKPYSERYCATCRLFSRWVTMRWCGSDGAALTSSGIAPARRAARDCAKAAFTQSGPQLGRSTGVCRCSTRRCLRRSRTSGDKAAASDNARASSPNSPGVKPKRRSCESGTRRTTMGISRPVRAPAAFDGSVLMSFAITRPLQDPATWRSW